MRTCQNRGPPLSQKYASRPPVESIFVGPALGKAPASGPWGFRHHGTSRRQTPTSAQARRRAGNGEERGRTPALATPSRSRSRAPTSRTASAPPQSGARGLVAAQNIPQRNLCGPSPRQGARPRQVGVPSSRNLEAPDAHERASTPQGREPRHAPALEPPASRGAYARLSQGPMVCYSRRALPAGRGPTVPQDRRRPPGRPI